MFQRAKTPCIIVVPVQSDVRSSVDCLTDNCCLSCTETLNHSSNIIVALTCQVVCVVWSLLVNQKAREPRRAGGGQVSDLFRTNKPRSVRFMQGGARLLGQRSCALLLFSNLNIIRERSTDFSFWALHIWPDGGALDNED